jgi:hypothetical protein
VVKPCSSCGGIHLARWRARLWHNGINRRELLPSQLNTRDRRDIFLSHVRTLYISESTDLTRPRSSAASSPTPVLIYVAQGLTKRADLQYISSSGGTINTNPQLALTFSFTTSGDLTTDDGRFISTASLEPLRFFPSATKQPISTIWEINVDRTITWRNSVFPAGQAGFCLTGSNIWIYFTKPPSGCTPVTLGAITREDVVPPISTVSSSMIPPTQSTATSTSASATSPAPGPIYGALATAEPVGCLTSPVGALVLNSANTSVSTLEQCVDICAAYISSGIDYHYIGVQFGEHTFIYMKYQTDSVQARNAIAISHSIRTPDLLRLALVTCPVVATAMKCVGAIPPCPYT